MVRHPRHTAELVNQEIARWRAELSRNGPEQSWARPRAQVVAMSHAVGSGGAEIARLVGEHLRLPVYDREIVEHIANTARVQVAVVETLDQHALTRLEEHVGSLFTGMGFDRDDYLRLLARTIGALWEHGPCVITGHGCVHLMPRSHALTVRTIATREARLARLAARGGIGKEEAEEQLQEADKERAGYHRKYFDADVDDATQYDLVVSTSELSPPACAELVAQAYRLRFRAQG